MLAKLIKHEFKATSRIFLPAYLAVFLMGLVGYASGRINITTGVTIPEWILVVGLLLFFGLITTTFILTFVINIQRFYKNLLGDEGYLMFTLPVHQRDLIAAKLIPATCWDIASTLVIILSSALIGLGILPSGYWQSPGWFALAQQLRSGLDFVFANYSLVVIEVIALFIIAAVTSILMMYVAMAIGQLASKNRALASVGAYFGIYTALQVIGSFLIAIFVPVLSNLEIVWTENLGLLLGGALSVYLAQAVLYFVVTNIILSKRLNLA